MFVINDIVWQIEYVPPNSRHLMRSDGVYTLGVTDWNDRVVYINNRLTGDKLRHVICHELVHSFMFSHSIYIPIEQEEYIANWVADYGTELIYILDNIMSNLLRSVA